MIVNSWNGQVDIGNRIAQNKSAGGLLVANGNDGRIQQASITDVSQGEPPPPGLNPSMYVTAQTGNQWYAVPDNSIVGRSSLLTEVGVGISHYQFFAPAGTVDLPTNQVQATANWSNIWRGDNFTYNNCSVLLTSRTYDGLISLGIIPRNTPRPSGAGAGGVGEPENRLGWVVTAVVVVAVLGAAVYFLPKDTFRGLAGSK